MNPYLNLAYGDGSLWAADEFGPRRRGSHGSTPIPTRSRGPATSGEHLGRGGWRLRLDERQTQGRGLQGRRRPGTLSRPTRPGSVPASWRTPTACCGWPTATRGPSPASTPSPGADHVPVQPPRRDDRRRRRRPARVLVPGQTVEDASTRSRDRGQVLRPRGPARAGRGAGPQHDPGAIQIGYATCAMLLNYPDEPGPGMAAPTRGRRGDARGLADGRTYTFTVRPGYQFSPPSNQPVTAETFRYSIERALSPRLAENPIGQIPPGPQYIDDIEGERAFRRGRARHISGLRRRGDTLSITLTKPSPTSSRGWPCRSSVRCRSARRSSPERRTQGQTMALRRLHTIGGPLLRGRLQQRGARDPEAQSQLPGPRPHSFDAIAILEGVGASIALDWIEQRGWDGITSLSDPLLDVGGEVARRWGGIALPRGAAINGIS